MDLGLVVRGRETGEIGSEIRDEHLFSVRCSTEYCPRTHGKRVQTQGEKVLGVKLDTGQAVK